MSFSYDSNLEIVTKDKQKIALASSGTVTLERPDKARITRRGGFADIESVFDGKTLTLLGKNANLYAQVKETLKKSENAPMARCKSLIFLDPESAKRNFSDGVSRFRRSWLEVEMAVLPTDVGSGGG